MRLRRGCIRSRISSREGSTTPGGSERVMNKLQSAAKATLPSFDSNVQPAKKTISGGVARVGGHPALLQIQGELLDEVRRDPLHLGGLLEDDERRQDLPLDVPRLEN